MTTAAIAGARGLLLFERNLMVYRRTWMIIFSGVFEPLFYLFSMGIGLGHFVGKVPGPGGHLVSYASFVAPALLAAYSVTREQDAAFPPLNRFVIMPMFLFSGTFFPVSQLPDWLEPAAWATPLWHGVELCRDLASGQIALAPTFLHVGYLSALVVGGIAASAITHRRTLLS